MFSKPSVIAALLLGTAQAHQNFHQLWVNGVSPGYQVGIRMPPSNNPVTDVTSNDITCNVNGNNVPSGVSTVAVKAGDTIKVQWDSSTHPGPITHMLYGPVSDASLATGVGAWAKIDELDYVGGKWANEIMEAQDMTREFKLPAGLASGDYLLRSEMLALHGSQTLGGAQFYIGCAQIRVTSPGGSCSPSIQLPGAYKVSDSNIYIPNFYNGFDPTTYTAPGGPVATCGGSGGATSSTKAATTSTTKAATPSSSTSKASSTLKPTTTLVTSKTTILTTAQPTTTATGTVSKYGQCGGVGYTGPTACVAGTTCTKQNDYYAQCL